MATQDGGRGTGKKGNGVNWVTGIEGNRQNVCNEETGPPLSLFHYSPFTLFSVLPFAGCDRSGENL